MTDPLTVLGLERGDLLAAAIGVSTSEAMLMLAKVVEGLAPRNLISIHPDTIRRMHAAALHRREDRP